MTPDFHKSATELNINIPFVMPHYGKLTGGEGFTRTSSGV